MYNLFVNRTDVYAKAYLKGSRMAYSKIQREITIDLIERHIKGEVTLGVYQLKDDRVKWACLDFDENTPKDYYDAQNLFIELKKQGLRPLFEKSGGGAYKSHIWIFCDCTAKDISCYIKDITELIGIKPHEIFPKQEEASDSLPYGNLVKLPLAYHLASKGKSHFLDDSFKPIENEKEIIQRLESHLNNKDMIPKATIKEKTIEDYKPVNNKNPNTFDGFFNFVLNNELPAGKTATNKQYQKIVGVNDNILKNLAIWFYQKGYTLKDLEREVKPTYDSKGWAFADLKGWFNKALKGDITKINIGELAEWCRTYREDLIDLLPDERKELRSVFMSDFMKTKVENEKYLLDGFIPEQSIISIWGEPASCKSFLSVYLSCCISTGRKCLGINSRKSPVLYLSTENPERTERKRFKAVFKGMGISPARRKYPSLSLEYVPRNSIGLINEDHFYEQLKEKIASSKIKLLIIDTLSPMISDADDNKANEIVQIFNERFFPLVDEFKLSILFLLHSQKTGKDFLGSVKLKASVDLSYELQRDKDNILKLLCHKSREGEHNLEFKITFHKTPKLNLDKVDFTFMSQFEGKQSPKKKSNEKKIDIAKEHILKTLADEELSFKEIVKLGESIGASPKTMKRAINSLYEEEEKIRKNGKDGGYVLA